MDNLDNSSTNEAAFQQNFEIVSSCESGLMAEHFSTKDVQFV